jgi:hypothetical protein
MQNVLAVTVTYTLDDLLEKALSDVFFKLSPLPHIVEQIATGTDLGDKQDVFLSLEVLVELHDVAVTSLSENYNLLLDLCRL